MVRLISLISAIILIFYSQNCLAQSDCLGADPFCTGTNYSFSNSTNVQDLGTVDCLGSSPNPTWYYMEIDQNGPMDFTINQNSTSGAGLDVDFAIWGPYASLAAGCGNPFPIGNPIDCSYSTAATENVNIPNAQIGQTYILLITNYSNQPGNITFSQTSGTGSADCSFTCGVNLTATPSVCNNNTYSVSGNLTVTAAPGISIPNTGSVTIANSCGGSQTFNAPFTNIPYNFTGLTANGASCTITATFSNFANCNTVQNYTAPASCVTSCAVTSVSATPTACNANQYNVNGQVSFTSPPTTGTLTVSGSCGGLQTFNAPFNSPLSYSFSNLAANGGACTVTATFSANSACTNTANYTAPASCSTGGCNITAINSAMASAGFQPLNVQGYPCALYYYNPNTTNNWNTAQSQANAVGATLLTVCSLAENNAVWNAAQAAGVSGGLWIGYTDQVSEGNWVWQDGSTCTFTNWNAGEPNNSSCFPSNDGEDGAVIQMNNGRWNDVYLGPTGFCLAPAAYASLVKVNLCPQVSATANPTSVCAGDPVQLSATTILGSSPYTYSWTNSSNVQVGTGSPITVNPSSSQVYSVTSTDQYGCVAIDTVNVTTQSCGCPAEIGTYNLSVNGNSISPGMLCFGDTLNILSNSNWTPPAEIIGATNPNSPNYDPNAPVYDPGIAWLIYSCPPTVSLTPAQSAASGLEINDDPCLLGIASNTPNFTDINDLTVINGFPAGTFQNNTVYYVPITMYSLQDGLYSYVTLPNLDCFELGTVTVVQYLPEITYSQTQDCANGTVAATINGGAAQLNGTNFSVVTGSITPQTAQAVNSTTTNGGTITISGLQSGPYSFQVQDANGCPITIQGNFTGSENADFTYPDNLYCTTDLDPAPVITGSPGGQFTSSNGLTLNSNTGSIDLSSSIPGSYSVTYTTPSVVCPGTENFSIVIESIPVVNGGPDQTICLGSSVTLSGSGAVNYFWNNGLTNGVPYLPSVGQTQFIVQGATNANCISSDTVLVTVENCSQEDSLIYWIPNTFTPDNDEYNQNWNVVFYSGFDQYSFELSLFNRWGELIWESFDLNAGWDGTYKNGMKAPDGVYTWKLKYKLIQNDLKVTVTGHVNVLR